MDKQSFFSLLDKYRSGTASGAEKALLEEYYRRLETAGSTEMTADEEAALKDAMFQQIAAQMHGSAARLVPLKKRNYSLVAAAAVVFILIGGVSYYYLSKTDAAAPTVVAKVPEKPKDLPPGRDAATLTLADGRTIILDTTSGTISQQGGATIINLNGQLSYAKDGDKATVVYNTVKTARGNQYQLVLADGSKVWLNSASSLRFPTAFTGQQREVELDGEGYFEIAKDASKPFHVKTTTQEIEVLGTHFNVNAYNDEELARTTLLEGSVSVRLAKNTTALTLKPGEQAIANSPLTTDHSPLTIDHSPDIDKVMAWKNGWFEFDDTDIHTIMRQVSRWYDVDIRYEIKTNKTYGGRISRNLNLSNILKMLESDGVHFRLEGKTLVVTK